MKCVCDHCDMTILANDPWCSVCYRQCKKMRFVEIFDREAHIEAGLLPIWFVISAMFLLGLPKDVHLVVLIAPFGFLIGLHWLFRFGKWCESHCPREPS